MSARLPYLPRRVVEFEKLAHLGQPALLHEPEVVRVLVVAFVRGSIGELHRDREAVAILRADLSQQLEQLNAGNSR